MWVYFCTSSALIHVLTWGYVPHKILSDPLYQLWPPHQVVRMVREAKVQLV